MTVCIAAACAWNYAAPGEPDDTGHALVIGSDMMMTDEGLGIEYEHTVKKSIGLSPNCSMLISGNNALHTGVLIRPEGTAWDKMVPPQIAREYAKQYRAAIAEEAEQFYLAPFGKTTAEFLAEQSTWDPATAKDISDKLGSYADYLKTDVLIVGAEKKRGFIAYMNKYGIVSFHDNIGFAAIGIGGDHAIGYLTQSKHSRWHGAYDVIWRVYCAKRRAEIAPGVGEQTILEVITANHTFPVTPDLIDAMAKRYSKLREQMIKDDEAAAAMIGEHINEKSVEAEKTPEKGNQNGEKAGSVRPDGGRTKQKTTTESKGKD